MTRQHDLIDEELFQFLFENKDKYKTIALQFPDDLLNRAPAILSHFRDTYPHISWSILADTSFGSCCVDEVAAEHINADLIIHFGPTCLSWPSRTDSFFSFGSCTDFLDSGNIFAYLESLNFDSDSKIILFPDLEYQHALLDYEISMLNVELAVARERFLSPRYPPTTNSKTSFLGRTFEQIENPSKTIIIQIGSNEIFGHALAFNFYRCKEVFRLIPATSGGQYAIENLKEQNKRNLMKRYSSICKCENVQIIGILVGTLGVSRYAGVIEHLKTIIRNAGKRPFVVLVGKLNPAKLANFIEISVFVNVACPLTTIVDNKEYFQAIISPFELEVALGLREWNLQEYSTEFSSILPMKDSIKEINSLEAKEFNQGPSSAMISVSNFETALVQSGLDKSLPGRSWYGLEVLTAADAPVEMASEGRRGIASDYSAR